MINPFTTTQRQIHRLIVLVNDSLQVELRTDLMEDDVTKIWLEIARKDKKKFLLCAVDIAQQILRWKRFLRQWVKVGNNHETYVILTICIEMTLTKHVNKLQKIQKWRWKPLVSINRLLV